MIFTDRRDAGIKLAEKLEGLVEKDGLVLAIPRGGVVVGAEIARKYKLELDLIIPRKIGSPENPEVAVGAVAQDGTTFFHHRLIKLMGISEFDLKERISCEISEIKRRMLLYRGSENHRDYEGRQIIVVDDGVATGYTMQAALRSCRNFKPSELILAIPVSPPDTLEILAREVDRHICLLVPEVFYAVGQFYENFEQTEDDEVIKIMKDLRMYEYKKPSIPEQYQEEIRRGQDVKKIIAVEEGLSNSIKAALENEGYTVVKPGTGGKVDATILSGLDDNVMGMQDITGKSAVIEASGRTAEQILKDLKERL